MANFPPYVKVLAAGYGEDFDPAIERSEMERGVPKERLINSQVLMKISATLLFDSPADITSFEDWYFTDIQRIGWFQLTHPRTLAMVSARFEEAKIGKLTPRNPMFSCATRSVVFEYLR
jgi:hypothetical protein